MKSVRGIRGVVALTVVGCAQPASTVQGTRGSLATSAMADPSPPPAPTLFVSPPELPTRSGDPATCFQDSYDLESLGQYELSLAAMDRLPTAVRHGYVALLRRGWLLSRLGNHEGAVLSYMAANAKDPFAVEARVALLTPLAALGRWAEVEATAREILGRDPGNHVALVRLAFAIFSLGRYLEAEVEYRTVLSLYPSDVDARSGVGWCLPRRGKKADATRAFSEALAIAPKNAPAFEGMPAVASIR